MGSKLSGKSVWEIFNEECPGVATAYVKLSEEINIKGVLPEKTRSLILVGIFSTIRDPVALKHFVRVAFKAGASKEEIEGALKGVQEISEYNFTGKVEEDFSSFEVIASQGKEVWRQLDQLIKTKGWQVKDFGAKKLTLEDTFIALVRETGGEQ